MEIRLRHLGDVGVEPGPEVGSMITVEDGQHLVVIGGLLVGPCASV
jgi:hypothetical protein